MSSNIYDFPDRIPAPARRPAAARRAVGPPAPVRGIILSSVLWLAFAATLLFTTVKVIRALSLPGLAASELSAGDQLRPSR